MKKKVVLIIFAIIGVLIIGAGLFWRYKISQRITSPLEEPQITEIQPLEKELIRSLVIKDITNFENAQEAKIDLGEIKTEDSKASVEVMLKWNEPGLCVGYHYELIKVSGHWEVKIRERTIVC